MDECTGPGVAQWLSAQGFDVFSIFDNSPGIPDRQILEKAFTEKWVIITNDKDFGDLIFRDAMEHSGVIFLRLENERSVNKILALKNVLDQFSDQIENQFIVATETTIRITQKRK
ncbi:MAG: DUF5615 family PIN-like protein [Bacteroidia bacterium]